MRGFKVTRFIIIIIYLLLVNNNSVFGKDSFIINKSQQDNMHSKSWPVLKHYDQNHIARIALPLGGIGTGTVSLGGRGNLQDWEIMNRPAKGFTPSPYPFFAIYIKQMDGKTVVRALEGPLENYEYEGYNGSQTPNHGLPRFGNCSFSATYPFGRVYLSDPDVPVDVNLEAFNPFIPGDVDASSIPVAVLRYSLTNKTDQSIKVSFCGNVPNFIGNDGSILERGWLDILHPEGENQNINTFRSGKHVQGIYMTSQGVNSSVTQWGTIALTTLSENVTTHRTAWFEREWGGGLLDYWDDFSQDGKLENRTVEGVDKPMASLAVELEIPAGETKEALFFITWHFPNRITWTPQEIKTSNSRVNGDPNIIGNYYTTQYKDAWDVAEKTALLFADLEEKTLQFVHAFCSSDFPSVVKESALFNLSTLRTQTCFRTPDGHFFGFEGCGDKKGCCLGSCTHVWNYEQATAFLFGDLAKTMRDVEFNYATEANGMMNFRVDLPLNRSKEYGIAAADGQMGCIMKMYRDWQLSGDDDFLKTLWPQVKKSLEFCWIPGGWDANQDGVMDGCQHNTMDVEYYGPNPQMGIWYLGALRAAEEMAIYLGEKSFAKKCNKLYKDGSKWIDKHLFNGEYYEHIIIPPKDESKIAKGLRHTMGADDVFKPDYQLGSGCLVDQLIGQVVSHVCGLGYLTNRTHVQKTLQSIMKYNYKSSMYDHFNNMRSYALGNESALLMASYPKDRPQFPFPYFTEVMTGFEYTAAIGMLYEGQIDNGLKCIQNIRNRYDGCKRSPFDEAECGHHYARAMISWAAVLALTGFEYSGVEKSMMFTPQEGTYFWSNGYAWGSCQIAKSNDKMIVTLSVLNGHLELKNFLLKDYDKKDFKKSVFINSGEEIQFTF